jgi:acyl-CoA reductase-like NAD-dependent aldehyde dehydrogenase
VLTHTNTRPYHTVRARRARHRRRRSGQTCVCTNRVLVQEGVMAAFAEKVRARVAAMTVGDPFDPKTNLGPLINRGAVEKVRARAAVAFLPTVVPASGHHAVRPCYAADRTAAPPVALRRRSTR